MTREIKFRAMLRGQRFKGWNYFELLDVLAPRQDFDRETVGQSTGLRDKNEKEIYEGDIIKKHDESMPEYDGAIGSVIYDEMEFVIKLESNADWAFYYPDGRNFTPSQLEVIGNIYQNPDLLK